MMDGRLLPDTPLHWFMPPCELQTFKCASRFLVLKLMVVDSLGFQTSCDQNYIPPPSRLHRHETGVTSHRQGHDYAWGVGGGMGTIILAMAPKRTETKLNGLHSKAQCCDRQKQILYAHKTPPIHPIYNGLKVL